MKYQLLEKDPQGNKIGSHRVGNKRYVAGQILESELPLDTLFRGKFKRILDNSIPVSKPEIVQLPQMRVLRQTKAVVDASQGALPNESPELASDVVAQETLGGRVETWKPPVPPVSKSKKSEHGVDVSDQFPDADLTGMKVYHNIQKDSFVVVDGKSGEVLKRIKMDKLVTKYLKSQLG